MPHSMTSPRKTPRFYLLGLGVEPFHHATVEVLQALGRCDVVYSQGLDAKEERYLRRFQSAGAWRGLAAGEVPSLAGLVRRDLKAGRSAAWATRGHPFYWNAVAVSLIRAAQSVGVGWETYGAVSPMGLALADMGVALGDEILGLQSFDIAALAGKGASINAEWPLVLYSYAALTRRDYESAARFLLGRYPPEHPVRWRRGAGAPLESIPLARLSSRYGSLDNVAVLCLPALRRSRSRLGRTADKPMSRTPERARAS